MLSGHFWFAPSCRANALQCVPHITAGRGCKSPPLEYCRVEPLQGDAKVEILRMFGLVGNTEYWEYSFLDDKTREKSELPLPTNTMKLSTESAVYLQPSSLPTGVKEKCFFSRLHGGKKVLPCFTMYQSDWSCALKIYDHQPC